MLPIWISDAGTVGTPTGKQKKLDAELCETTVSSSRTLPTRDPVQLVMTALELVTRVHVLEPR